MSDRPSAASRGDVVIATYNVLAHAYVRADRYPGIDPAIFDRTSRENAIAERVRHLAADVVCLQEVERGMFASLTTALAPDGYVGCFEKKGGSRPDGCAVFFRGPRVRLLGTARLDYADLHGTNGAPSGHVALLARFACRTPQGERELVVAGTHVRWAPPELAPEEHVGHRQTVLLAERLANEIGARADVVACGDFNATHDSHVLAPLLALGLVDAYASCPTPTACANGHASRIDFLLGGAALVAEPVPLPHLDDDASLPRSGEPSDHLPLAAAFTFARD